MDNGKFKTESDDLVTLWQGDCLDVRNVVQRFPELFSEDVRLKVALL